jgi:hypothetical protein
MRGEGDAALPVHVVDLGGHALMPVHALLDADGNHMVAGREDFLARQDGRPADSVGKTPGKFSVDQLVVPRDGDRVQALTLGFQDKSPWRQCAIAPH